MFFCQGRRGCLCLVGILDHQEASESSHQPRKKNRTQLVNSQTGFTVNVQLSHVYLLILCNLSL